MRFGPPPRITTFSRSEGLGFGRPAPRRSRRRVGGVHVGCGRGELGRAGVDALEHRAGRRVTWRSRRDLGLGHRPPSGSASRRVREAGGSSGPAGSALAGGHAEAASPWLLEVDDVLDLALDEPRDRTGRPRGSRRGSCRGAAPGRRPGCRSGVGHAEGGAQRRPAPRPGTMPSHRDLVEAVEARSPASAAPSAAISAKVRPIAMASPTDFMAVLSSGSAPGNFSKAKRGILVTT